MLYKMSDTDENILLEETEETENIQKKQQKNVTKPKEAFKEEKPKLITKKKVIVVEEEEEEEEEKPVTKQKPKRTEAQRLAFERCKAKREENAKKRAEDAKKLLEYEKKALEEKLIAKAVSIKKKQIKKQIVLDEISDDDTPIETIKEMAKKNKAVVKAPEKPKPLFNFI
jgi:hypothetical protein